MKMEILHLIQTMVHSMIVEFTCPECDELFIIEGDYDVGDPSVGINAGVLMNDEEQCPACGRWLTAKNLRDVAEELNDKAIDTYLGED